MCVYLCLRECTKRSEDSLTPGGSAMATDREDSRTLQILEDIRLHAGADVLRSHIQRCSRQKLESWKDGHGLDLLHYAIMENSYVAAGTFFGQGFFKPPHEPSTASWSYVHMAAALGYRSILSLLLQERPYDNKKVTEFFRVQ